MEQVPLNPLSKWIRDSIVAGFQAAVVDIASGGALSANLPNGHALPPAPEPEESRPRRVIAKPGRKREPKRLTPPDPPPDVDGPPLPKGEKTKQQRRAVAEHLSKVGKAKMADIARECGVPDGSIAKVLAYHWFDRQPDGWTLTKLGREEFFDDERGD
jgi:hypothetical protein